jgi:superfamily II DNA or RNA helicase/diadenosine tetraphosphate (Ap4A) HIT family hydrolase
VSPFLALPQTAWVASNDLAFAICDAFPVSPGHTLVISRRLVPDWFSATEAERLAVMALVEQVKVTLDAGNPRPDGYNVGFNAGAAAGQTVMHLHVHVIPRYRGDVSDPRGGVRHVIPSKGNYLATAPGRESPDGDTQDSRLATGGLSDPFARHIMPLLERATDVAIVAAFVQEGGVRHLDSAVRRALRRGASIRLVTGDYLEITQAQALEHLLEWQQVGAALAEDDEDVGASTDGPSGANRNSRPGRFEARIVEVSTLPLPTRSFHPKSWRFEGDAFGVAYVGSSNLSHGALETGIEWNLRVDRAQDAHSYARVAGAFESVWDAAKTLTPAWVEAYAERAKRTAVTPLASEVEIEPLDTPPDQHAVQAEALAALRAARKEGRRRALAVLATGLGKTWLAAFDFVQLQEELGRRPRLLFLAHRQELLRQAALTYRRLLHFRQEPSRVGWFVGDEEDLSAPLVFASVAKLARPEHLARLASMSFDYVVVDEVHHAAAESYRRILAALDPGFLLGLTATPDRADEADIGGLFDDFVACRADVARGVEIGRLVPFQYFGVKDDIDYEQIPWRNRRFDPEALAQAAQTQSRMETLWRAWREHPGNRSLVFCCSIAHANYVRSWLRDRGVRVAAVYSADGSDDREGALEAFSAGQLDALCAVDVFNEGVDVPTIDRVVMLRPTESSVVFLQQLGRGLRAFEGKTSVTVIDFVGNHRIFLERVRALLSLASSRPAAALRELLESGGQVMPSGCSVELELEAKDLLSSLFRVGGADEVERVYRELRTMRGVRPSPGELQRMGYLPGRLRDRHGSWFGFVRAEGDLDEGELRAANAAEPFLRDLETTEMTKSFKMVTLEALLDAGALATGMPLGELARSSHAILRRSPELHEDVADEVRFESLGEDDNAARWLAYWRRNPVAAWTQPRGETRPWFRLDGDRFTFALAIDSAFELSLARLVRELVDWRLAQYRQRKRLRGGSNEGFFCKVTWNRRDPILKLPPRTAASFPEGETDVRLPDGAVWQFRFAKEFCNVARPVGSGRNELPDLLRRWFGPRAGQPGTAFEVRLEASPDGLWIEPVQVQVVPPAGTRHAVVAYPDLRAAAGHAQASTEVIEREMVALPVDDEEPDRFAVRVAGSSMDGGKEPLRDGDWAIMRLARGAPADALAGRVVLVQVPGEAFGSQYQIKRLVRRGGQFVLASDNPEGPTFEPAPDTVPIARLERAFHPEDLGPAAGTSIPEADLAAAFGLGEVLPRTGRYAGHLFAFVDERGLLVAPDRLRIPVADRRPGETAFVLARRADGAWRALGVGRWSEDDALWHIPEVDFATWRAWGEGRDVSRRLSEGALARAQQAVDALLRSRSEDRWIEQQGGRRARIVGEAPRGGLRIDGGDGGFAERTVSLPDLAWVVAAEADVRANGGVLGEERVNRLRYLEGTPKGSTRWIDTGWAIAAWAKGRGLVREPVAGAESQLRRVRKDDGSALDASFRVERVGDAVSIVYESRGGTRGSEAERNSDYAAGLEVLLERMKGAGLKIADLVVESRDTATLRLEERRIGGETANYPVAIKDPASMRKWISTEQAKVGRAPGARGAGNRTRRLRIFVEGPAGWDETALTAVLR